MSNISDQSGDEREQRIAELKKKMQEKAAKAKAEREAAQAATSDTTSDTTSDAAANEEATSEEVVEEKNVEEVVAEAVVEADAVDDAPAGEVVEVAEEAAVAAAVAEPVYAYMPKEKTEEEKLRSQMNRREFLTYTWGAAMGLLLLGSGVATFQFMYPRFKAGEFGGAFAMGPNTAVPSTDAAPEAVADGKFWWVNTEEEGPQALYMVCTHLGCLYKWVDERYRFECPCHGSKFTREGLYIEGPAPRSLDTFVTAQVDGEWIVDTGAKVLGAPASESTAAGTG